MKQTFVYAPDNKCDLGVPRWFHLRYEILFIFLEDLVTLLAHWNTIVRVMSGKGALFVNTAFTEHIPAVPAVILLKENEWTN